MKYFIAILVLLSLAISHASATTEDHVAKKMFASFMRKYNKNYATNDEFQLRYQNFKNSIERAQLRNAEAGSNTYGITKFSDLSPQEFRAEYLMNTPFPYTPDNKKDVIKPKNVGALPTTLDWRAKGAVTPVKNQKQCGSCWAFSVTENIESMWILAGKATNETIDLAPQQIVDCDTSDDGCNGGNPPTAYEYVIKAGGMEAESSYPYVAKDTKCTFDKSKVVATISSWKYATTDKNEQTMQQNLYSVGPLSICVDAASWQDYNGGVVKSGCGHTLDHCVEVVGYDATNSKEPYWIVRNSWGTDWGYDGYIYVIMGQNMCGIAQEVTTSIIN